MDALARYPRESNTNLGGAATPVTSHGCIRIDNNAINLIARVATEGTPVTISR